MDRETAYLSRHRHPLPAVLKLGVMLEVPSLLFQIDEICAMADFISVGSNDLMQFFYAVDRGNKRVSDRFDPLSAPMLRAMKTIVDKCHAAGKPVTLLVGVVFFLIWDIVGIDAGVFFRGETSFMTGVQLAPELPLEEVFFLVLLCWLTMNLLAGSRLVLDARERRRAASAALSTGGDRA